MLWEAKYFYYLITEYSADSLLEEQEKIFVGKKQSLIWKILINYVLKCKNDFFKEKTILNVLIKQVTNGNKAIKG